MLGKISYRTGQQLSWKKSVGFFQTSVVRLKLGFGKLTIWEKKQQSKYHRGNQLMDLQRWKAAIKYQQVHY